MKKDIFEEEYDEDFYSECDKYYDFEELEEQSKQEIIEEIKKIANDKIDKQKTYEQYINERKEEEIIPFLGPCVITYTQEEIEKTKKDLKKYIIENQKEILKNNMTYMTNDNIKEIEKIPEDGIIEIGFNESINKIMETRKYHILKNFGLVFMEAKDEKLIIHFPLIKEMKKALKDNELMKKQKEINEKAQIISGICELYGAIKTEKIFEIFEKIYGTTNKDKFEKFLIMVSAIFEVAQTKKDNTVGKLQFIYENWIDEESAKKIIKENKTIKIYNKEEYLKYGEKDYLTTIKGYEKLKKQFDTDILDEEEVSELINNLIMPHIIEARINDKDINEIVRAIEMQLVNIIGEDGYTELGLDINMIKEAIKEIIEELPKWI